jgi:predicted acetyltransferase
MELARPRVSYRRSFLAAVDEFLAAGEDQYAGLVDVPADSVFPGMRFTRQDLESPAVFADMVRFVVGQEDPRAPRPSSYVPSTTRWMVEGRDVVGWISLRHELTELLLTWGGHIGYAVRPSARRRGFATEAVRQMLPLCAARGLAQVLITCDEENLGSRRVIEGHGGVYEDSREGKRRYWVPTT